MGIEQIFFQAKDAEQFDELVERLKILMANVDILGEANIIVRVYEGASYNESNELVVMPTPENKIDEVVVRDKASKSTLSRSHEKGVRFDIEGKPYVVLFKYDPTALYKYMRL